MPTAAEFLDAPADTSGNAPSMPAAADFLDAPANAAAPAVSAPSAVGYLDTPATAPNELPDAHPAAPGWFQKQWDYLKGLPSEINNRLGQGEFKAASNMVRGASWGIGKLYDVADAVMPESGAAESKRNATAFLDDLAGVIDRSADKNFKLNPTYQQDLSANLSQMVGDLGTTLGFGKVLTVPGAFALSSGARGQQEAIAAGHPEQADKAFMAQGAIGAIAGAEFPESNVLSSLTREPVLTEIAKSAAQGSAVVAGQTAASNVAAAALYDPNRPIGQGVGESALGGFIIGGAMRAVPEVITRGGSEPTLPKAEDFLGDTVETRRSTADFLDSPSNPPVSVLPKAEDFLDQPATTAPEVQTPGEAPPPPLPFRQDDRIPFMTRVRWEDQLTSAGYDEPAIDKLSGEEAWNIVNQLQQARTAGPSPDPEQGQAPAANFVEPDPQTVTTARPLTAADRAEAEHRQELLDQSREAQAAEGKELLEAIIDAGGLPAKAGGARAASGYTGELDHLDDMVRNYRNRQEPISANRLFRSDAPGLDRMAESLRDQGFDIQTPNDLLEALDQRLRTGKEQFGTPAREWQMFASGSASPHRGPQKPLPPQPPSSPAIQAATAPVRSWWQQRTLLIRKLVAPQTIDAPARKVGNIVRDYNGQLANKIIQADHALSEARKDFDRTPVPKNWTYDPNKPLPRNYAFMAASERGGTGLSPADRALKAQMDGMFAEAVDEVHRVKPTALKSLIQDYFPHIWQDPAAAQRAFASIVGTRPLEGSRGFLKQRTLAYIEDGLKMGLKPISDNPIDMVLTKLHEVHKFVAAQDMLTEAKAIGARKFVYIFEKPPDGWVKVDDPTSTVHGPPFVTVPEAFDAQMKAKTIELLDSLGIKSARVNALGGKRWGTYTEGGAGIKTKFAGPTSVYWHELGHGLQERYGWLDTILRGESPAGKSNVATELRNLADLRGEGLPPNKSFKSYIRSADEKAAVMLEAYMHAPQRMRDVAPVIYGRVQKFIQARPELHGIEDIRPSLVLGSSKQQIDTGGMVTLGHYYMPEGAAAVLNNYLSPGLQRFGIVRNIRTATNVLSSAQLGFSAFHAGFTSIDAAVSQFAAGLQHASEGRFGKAIVKIGTTPLAPVMNYYTGKAIQEAMIDPGWAGKLKMLGKEIQLSPEGQARAEDIAQLAVKAGLRATVDPFWKTQVTRNMMRAWHEGGVKGFAGTVLRLPFAVSEQMMRPILEYLVPRQKLGVFAGIANAGMDRLGPNADVHAVRDMLAQAADSTEDRMGMMTYDNMFYNRVVRDAALMGFRSYGWTYGKYRALAGGIADTVQTPGRMMQGGPVLTPRMAYLVALPMMAAGVGSIMNYLMTGQAPQDWRDALMPRTGRLDANGNPQRLSLPTYIKDMLSDWHDFPNMKKMLVSVSHKLTPIVSIGAELMNNADFMNTKIANEDDPFLKQQADRVGFVLKSMVPFSVTGAQRLSESHPSLMQEILPFFGFVPAKAELSMTPAQIRAAELMHNSMPQGARTADQAAHQHLISQLIRDMKQSDPGWQSNMADALRSGQLKQADIGHLLASLPLSPMQYQVKKLGAEDAMKVWDLANDQERQQIRPIIMNKIATAKALTPEQRAQYLRVIVRP